MKHDSLTDTKHTLFVTCNSALCEQLHNPGLSDDSVLCQAPVTDCSKLTSTRPPMT
jgi:hypothetical protein